LLNLTAKGAKFLQRSQNLIPSGNFVELFHSNFQINNYPVGSFLIIIFSLCPLRFFSLAYFAVKKGTKQKRQFLIEPKIIMAM
jgi:hypothetical protein